MNERAEPSGISLHSADAAIVKGMLVRGDRQHDIAAWFGVKASIKIEALPMSAYEYCNLIQDAFLMRTISILDCCCLLAVEVLELDINPRQANIERIRKSSGNHLCCAKLQALSELQSNLRAERNVRFHRSEEEMLTDDDTTFKTVALFSQAFSPSNEPTFIARAPSSPKS